MAAASNKPPLRGELSPQPPGEVFMICRKEQLKNSPSIKAKLNIVEAIEEGDSELSKWWLERKEKNEFSTKQEIDANVDADVTINIELSDDE